MGNIFSFMVIVIISVLGLIICPLILKGQIGFDKRDVAFESFESVAVFDVNNDGIDDIVSGPFWFEGPEYVNRHYIGNVERTGNGQYWNQFGIIPIDVNGDGYLDFVTGDWFEKGIWWMENPGDSSKEWRKHFIDSTGNVEIVEGFDLDGDGVPEIIPNTPGLPLKIYKLLEDGNARGNGKFKKIKVGDIQGHGLGFGDVNGNGIIDILTNQGWYYRNENSLDSGFNFSYFEDENGDRFNLGEAGIPIVLHDFNGDGLGDMVVGQAHDYGLDWYEQKRTDQGKIYWLKNIIDPFNSQFHALSLSDIDNDGKMEVITGKRFWAHNGEDPGAADPIGIYYLKWNGQGFSKTTISLGELGSGKGSGLSFVVKDLNKNGKKDIIVAGKDGLVIFYQN